MGQPRKGPPDRKSKWTLITKRKSSVRADKRRRPAMITRKRTVWWESRILYEGRIRWNVEKTGRREDSKHRISQKRAARRAATRRKGTQLDFICLVDPFDQEGLGDFRPREQENRRTPSVELDGGRKRGGETSFPRRTPRSCSERTTGRGSGQGKGTASERGLFLYSIKGEVPMESTTWGEYYRAEGRQYSCCPSVCRHGKKKEK